MTIKSNGGIFGRNPTFNNVTVDGVLTVDQIVEKTSASGITLDGVTLKDGNVVLASGKGIDFSATAGAGTSELFSDYEEGTFTPNQGVGLTVVGAFSSEGRYTKIGRTITIQGYVAGATSIAVSTNGQMFTNAPFVATLTTAGSAAGYAIGNSTCLIINGTSTVSSNTAIGASSAILFTMTYSV